MAKLEWPDYLVFGATLAISLGIGVFFAIWDKVKGKNTYEDYIMGGRHLRVIPVFASIVSTLVNAVALLGVPLEVYYNGAQFVLTLLGGIFGTVWTLIIFVPLMYPLQLISMYEYFEMRFHSKFTRLFGTALSLIKLVLENALILYIPGLAFEAVTDLKIWVSIVVCGATVTIYTLIGGMTAVVWTDLFQTVIMLGGLIVIGIKGIVEVGGFSDIWNTLDEWDRTDFFIMDADPRAGNTFWSTLIGMSVWAFTQTNQQTSVQRYSALPTMKKAKLSIMGLIPFTTSFGVLFMVIGATVFTYYAKLGCDPLIAGKISDPNQVIPLFVVDVMGTKGFAGLFIACIFGGSLSTISSNLNASAAITWEDALKPCLPNWSSQKVTVLMKILVFIYGGISIGIAFGMEHVDGTIIQLFFTITAVTVGPVIAVQFAGACIPRASAAGTMIGGILSFLLVGWMGFGSVLNEVRPSPRPLPIHACGILPPPPPPDNSTMAIPPPPPMTPFEIASMVTPKTPDWEGLDNLYAVSYLWYALITMVITFITALISALIPMTRMEPTPEKLLFPFVRSICRCCFPGSMVEDDKTDREGDTMNNNAKRQVEQVQMETQQL